jgi:hypothetical protein
VGFLRRYGRILRLFQIVSLSSPSRSGGIRNNHAITHNPPAELRETVGLQQPGLNPRAFMFCVKCWFHFHSLIHTVYNVTNFVQFHSSHMSQVFTAVSCCVVSAASQRTANFINWKCDLASPRHCIQEATSNRAQTTTSPTEEIKQQRNKQIK